MKHGVRVSVVNLYDDQFGNAKLPLKFETVQKRRTRLRWAETGRCVACACRDCCWLRNFLPREPATSTLALWKKVSRFFRLKT